MKSKFLISVIVILGVSAAGLGVWVVYLDKKTETVVDSPSHSQQADSERFRSEYPKVSADNRFIYASTQEVLNIFESGSGLVFLGFPECPWCQQLAPIVDEAAKTEELDKIHYLNIRKSRQDNDVTYQQLVAKLGEHLGKDESGEPRIYVPDVTALRDGEIVGHFKQESTGSDEKTTSDTFWTPERHERGVLQLRQMISSIND